MATSIQISDELWEKLNKMKTSEYKTFQDVLEKLVDENRKLKNGPTNKTFK